MIEKTKITLSFKEQELVNNTDWFFTKQAIIEKVYQLFGNALSEMQELVYNSKEQLPEAAVTSEPKISKGENYQGLPYVMLDYPRSFAKEGILAVRTFFWWGNFFSVTLQLSGKYKTNSLPALIKAYPLLSKKDYWICISTDLWQHHFGEDNYLPVKDFTQNEFSAMLSREPFVKIAKKVPVNEWPCIPEFIGDVFAELTELLKTIRPQGDEKVLSPGIPTTGSDL